MISQEIRTPLNHILGMATALQESDLQQAEADMVGTIADSGDALLNVLTDLLDLAKIEAGSMTVDQTGFNLPRLLRETNKGFASTAGDKGLKFDLEFGTGIRGSVKGDPTKIKKILSCLLSGAVARTSAGEISVQAMVEEGVLTLEISDTGVTLSEDSQKQLTQALEEGTSFVPDAFEAEGLRLEISQKFCRLMGGELRFAPGKSRGSVFAATMRVTPCARDGEERTFYPEIKDVLKARQWRVLAAEDNQTNQRVLELLLKRYDFDLQIVEDGLQLVNAFQANPAHIVLLDVNMPVLNGIEAAARIRVFERANRMVPVPIIALTANAMSGQIKDYLSRGMDAHVPKPIRREELAGCMARLLRPYAE
ncbi:Autoinducer 2 sensor kinase/phosphatase LuxQ [Pelagimonas phthalicica]|uniref:histidine kinase n=2 Tax=Pelagimonas phthalicica TaxID=1037362 RepID=A0A238JFY4_9RHOB|nr:Autoinducer 2 sensor kinase/phosphatase LuxQ [Pelagimonas phthalicica]